MSAVARSLQFNSPQKSRMAAVILLVVAVMLIISIFAIPAWWLYQRYNATEQQMARQLSSYTALNQLRPKLLQATETLRAKDAKKYFLKGATPALVGADLQDVVKEIIEAKSGRVLSSQLLAHKDDNGYRLVNATIQMTANIQNLRHILYALESREPYLFVENLTIRAQVPSGFKPQAGFEPDMFIQFDVSGLAPISATTAAASTTEKKSAHGVSRTGGKP
ncbi:MAG: type II secretion system protein GspM [Pseudomonadota bacterium]